jgi:serine/threonine protein kinase
VIGRYKLLEQIGEGGFGVVYVAEQREPVKRRVALNRTFDTGERF